MNIGRPIRIHEIKPLRVPLETPAPQEQPVQEPARVK